jgi:hypothetical protein
MGLLSSRTSRGGKLNPLIIFLDDYNGVSIPTTATAGVKRLSLVEMQFQCRNATARYAVRAIYARSEAQSMRRPHGLQFCKSERDHSEPGKFLPLVCRSLPD